MRWLVLVSLFVTACATPPPPVKPVEAPKDPAEQVRAVLTAIYAGVAQGDADQLIPLFTDDAMVFGLGPGDTYNQRESFLARLTQVLLPLGMGGDTLAITDSAPVIGLSGPASSAWLFDFPKVLVVHKAVSTTWLPRITAHLVRVEGSWKLDALHVSLGVADELVYAPDAQKRLLPPSDVANERGPRSEELIGLTRRLLEDFEVKIERSTDRREFVEIGSSPAEVFELGQKFKELSRPALPAIRKEGYSWKVDGNLRAHLAPDGKTGWAAGNVILRIGAGKKQKVLPAFRTLWIFLEEKGLWNIASEHQSLGIKEDLRQPASAEELAQWADSRAIARKSTQELSPEKPSSPKLKTEPGIGAW